MNINLFFRFFFLLILLSGLAYLFYLNPFSSGFWSPHSFYQKKLIFSSHSTETIDEWKLANSNALNDSLVILPPLEIIAKDLANKPEARAYRLALHEGEKLLVELKNNATKDRVFFDLFFVENKNSIQHLVSGKKNHIEYSILETGEYLLRFQAPIGIKANFSLNITTEPTYAVFPVEGKSNKSIQSFWGAPRDGGKRKHEGVDIFAKKGTPVLAVCDGVIDRVKNGGLGGKTVWLYDEKLDQSIYYAHLDEQLVSENEYVKAGQMLGTVGNTGNAKTTPPHLHFGIYLDAAIDPLFFIKKNKGNYRKVKAIKGIGKTGIIRTGPARMYFAPNAKSKARKVLIKGLEVDIIGGISNYYQIRTHQGESYFVKEKDLFTS